MGARSKARKKAMDLLYEAEQKNIDFGEMLDISNRRDAQKIQKLSENDYANAIVDGVHENYHRLQDVLESHLRGWTVDRLFPVDRAILRIALWELLYTDTQPEVIRSEALSLAGEYGSDDAVSFIGGIIGNVVRENPISE